MLAHLTHPTPKQTHTLRPCCLITDGNTHRDDLYTPNITFTHQDLISEAMLPEIRQIATLIAASRHTFTQKSPQIFTEEADWFAARIIVLNARIFHLEISLKPMLDLANQRAKHFAQQYKLPFQAAQIRPGLHTKRPANMLLMECALTGSHQQHIIHNTQQIRQQLTHIQINTP